MSIIHAPAPNRHTVGPAPRKSTACLAGAVVTALSLYAGVAAADDTEVYFAQTKSDTDTNANVLFVLDTSGSMRTVDGTDGRSRMDKMKDAVKTMLEQAEDLNVGLMQFNGKEGGGPILFPVTNIDEEYCAGASCAALEASATVAAGTDDAEEYLSDNSMLVTGNTLELTYNSSHKSHQAIGLRFPDLAIPRGAKIIEARLDLTSQNNSKNGSVSLDITSEQVGHAAPFDGDTASVTGRSWHVARKTWPLGSWENQELYSSTDISELVKLVTDRPDWCGGNALALKLERSGGAGNDLLLGNGKGKNKDSRAAMTFESVAKEQKGQVPRLRVRYTLEDMPATGGCMRSSIANTAGQSRDDAEEYSNGRMFTGGTRLDMPRTDYDQQTIGVRFADVRIPRRATVRKAWLEFYVESQQSGYNARDVAVSIRGHNVNSSWRFRNDRWRHISNRANTSSETVWSIPNAAGGAKVQTDDLSSIVQEIINRRGWKSGNALGFQIRRSSGDGTRGFRTYDADRSRAPRLVIEFDDLDKGRPAPGSVASSKIKVREQLINTVDALAPVGYTPIVDTLWEAGQYFRGRSVDFGKQRGLSDQGYARSYYRLSHPNSYKGGTLNRSVWCGQGNLNASTCRSEYLSGNPVYKSPIANSCQTNHIVFLSDGEPVSNASVSRVEGLSGVGSCKARGDGTCGPEMAKWLYDNDLSSTLSNKQNVTTHTIAFSLDDSSYLGDIARDGGGSLYEADDTDELLAAFRSILDGVQSIDTSFTAPGATVNQFNRLTHRSDIYFAMFKPTDRPRWSGNLKRFRIGKVKESDGSVSGDVLIRDRTGKSAVDEETGFFSDDAFSFWEEKDEDGATVTTPDGHDVRRGGAANQMALDGLQRVGERRTYTWAGKATDVPAGGVDLTLADQKLDESNDKLTASVLGIDGFDTDTAKVEARRQKLLKWARGVDVNDEDGDGSTDDTRHHMGDPMHSRPVILNYADGDENDVDADGNQKSRSIVFLATNEGYLHAIDTANGEEQFSFMPRELLANLNQQYENKSSVTHLYGLDGQLSLWRSDVDGDYVLDADDKAYLFIGMRRGGNRYYALDITDLDKPRLAWAIEGGQGDFEQLGQTWSRMAPVKMLINGKSEDVLLFGGGYDTAQDADGQPATDGQTGSVEQKGRGIYIVRVEDGALLWSGLGTGGTQTFADMDYPIPADLRAIDVNRDGYVDQIYAADVGGQVWRFDVKQQHTSGERLMEGGVIADLSGSSGEHHRRFYAEPDVALVEDGGERFLTVSVGSGWRAHPLDTKVSDRFYVLRQNDVTKGPGRNKYGIEDANGTYRAIVDSDLTAVGGTLDPSQNANGWYLELSRTGEKVLGTSTTFDNRIIFSSYVPEATTSGCAVGIGGGRAYVLDILSGAPAQDLDKDKDIDDDDQSVALKHSGLPPEAMILLTQDSGDEPVTLVGTEMIDTGFRNATRRTFWSDRGEGEPIVAATPAGGDGEADGEGDGEGGDDELAESGAAD